MIKTKKVQLVNAQNGESAIVFFHCSHSAFDRVNNLRLFNIQTLIEVTENGQAGLKPIGESKAVYKEATFQALFGLKTVAEFEAELDALMIAQIDYINKYNWQGTEAQKPVKYWTLTAADLEIVV